MNNVSFRIKKKSFWGMLFYGQICTLSLRVNIDNEREIMVAPANVELLSLSEGVHTIRASLPFRGNEVGAVTQEIRIEPNTKYEIEYDTSVSWSTNSYSGNFIITEIK